MAQQSTQRSWGLTLTQNLHLNVYSNFIHNCQTWEQPRCPSGGGWINKLWSMQTTKHYPVLKRNELSSQEETRRRLKCISPSGRSQSEKAPYCVILTLWHSGKSRTMETIKKKNQCFPGERGDGEGWMGGAQRVFGAVILCHTIMVDTRHSTFTQVQSAHH